MPSPSEEHPGLLIRDPYRFSDAVLIVPPPLVACLECFDGGRTDLDLRELLVRTTGSLEVGEIERGLVEALSGAGFLEDETFGAMREQRLREFAQSPVREPAHAGGAYPAEPEELRQTLAGYMAGDAPSPPRAAGDGW